MATSVHSNLWPRQTRCQPTATTREGTSQLLGCDEGPSWLLREGAARSVLRAERSGGEEKPGDRRLSAKNLPTCATWCHQGALQIGKTKTCACRTPVPL